MPVRNFAVSALQGATPGLSRLASALGGDGSYQNSYDREIGAQSRLAQSIAAARASEAAARAHDAQAGEWQSKQRVLDSRPDLYDEQVAIGSGTDIPTVRALRQTIRTGQAPQVDMGPPAEDGRMGVGSMQFDPEQRSKISQQLIQLAPLLSNTGDLNPEQMAKASGLDRTSALSDAIINGTANRNLVGGAQAAAAGKDLYNRDSTGTVLDQFTGGLNESGGLAQSKIAENKATAADRYASAGAHNASAAKTRMDIEQGIKTGDIVVVTDNDGNTSLLNKRTGISRPATSEDGVPLKGKSVNGKLKDIPATANAKIIEGAQGLTNIDQALAALEQNPGAVGWSNMIPGAQTVKQLWSSPQDIATRAQVSNIGSLVLHDRSGAAVSASEFPRLAPFIPSASDSAKAGAAKLREMKRIAEDELGLYAGTYGPDNGYRESPLLRRRATDATSPGQPGTPGAVPAAGLLPMSAAIDAEISRRRGSRQ